jgi:hypothetical protein
MNFHQIILASTTSTEASTTTVMDSFVTCIKEISEAVTENGPLVVLFAIFIIAFLAIFIIFLKMTNSLLTSVIDEINAKNTEVTKYTNAIMDKFLNSQDDKTNKEEAGHKKDIVGLYIDTSSAFKAAATAAINTLRGDRIGIYVFHNGNKTPYGLPFVKMSCVFELTVKGNATIRSKAHIDLPLHIFSPIIESLYDDNEFCGNGDDIEIYGNSLKEFLQYSDAKSVFIEGITKEDGTLVGFTSCEYNHPMDFTDKDTYKSNSAVLKHMNDSIKYIITNDEFAKKYEQE